MEKICTCKLQLDHANLEKPKYFHLKGAANAMLTSIYHSCLLNSKPYFSFYTIQLLSLTSRKLLLCKGGTAKTRTAASIILITHKFGQIASKRHSDRYPNTLYKFLSSTRTLCYCSETLNQDGVYVPHGN